MLWLRPFVGQRRPPGFFLFSFFLYYSLFFIELCWLRAFVGQRGLGWNKKNPQPKKIPSFVEQKRGWFFFFNWKMRFLRALVEPAGRPGSFFFFHWMMRWPPRLCRPGAGRCVWVFVVCVLETHNVCVSPLHVISVDLTWHTLCTTLNMCPKLATQKHLLFLIFIYCCGRCVCVFVVFLLFMLCVSSSQHNSIHYSYYLFFGGGLKFY